MKEKIDRLQNYLSLIRISAGWSATELGAKLDLSRQMISNLENKRNKMTVVQYRAIRNVLDEEIARSAAEDDTQMLKDLIHVLVDESERFTEEQRNRVISDATLLASSVAAKKTTRKKASIAWASLTGAVLYSH